MKIEEQYTSGPRITEEKRIVRKMIALYCRKKEGNATLCAECEQLIHYAEARLDHCKFGEKKNTCRQCPVHCYKPAMREKMRAVMRWAGPRMMLYHPMDSLRHMWREMFAKRL